MKKSDVINTIRKNGKFYLMEAVGIGGFVFLAGATTIFLDHPSFPVMRSWLYHYPFLRRVGLGLVLGGYVGGTVALFGKLSGTQVNPSVTLTMFRLRKISLTNALCYIIAQFIGALAGFYLLKGLAGGWFSYPTIDYGVSKPQAPHTLASAFIAEFVISFILMATVLVLSSSRRGEKYMAVGVGTCLALFVIFELPYSGMSMNPARSLAAAVGSNEWRVLWVYFVSPSLAMLLAAELYLVMRKRRLAKRDPDYKEMGMFPAEES